MTAITTSKPQPDNADGLPANDNNADLASDDFSISMLIPDELNTDEVCRRAERLANATVVGMAIFFTLSPLAFLTFVISR
jgi:hypothetical protein